MSIPVRIAEDVAAPARAEAELTDRSLTAQIEHWAKLGMALERVLGHGLALELKKRGLAIRVEEAITAASTPAGQDTAAKFAAEKDVRYSAHPTLKGRIVRIAKDGTRVTGRMQGRRFVPDDPTEP